MIPLRDVNRSSTTPTFTILLIVLCTTLYIYQTLLSEDMFTEFIYSYGYIPNSTFNIETNPGLITSIFLHGSWFHLISNMWFLWIFGDNVEDRMGHFNFLLFFILCGVGANLVHMLSDMSSLVPAVGASGAIAGTMGAYFGLFPRAKIKTLIPIFIIIPIFVNIPASIFIVLWFISQIYSGAIESLSGGGSVEGVAWWAHVGGAAGGFVIYRIFLRRKKEGSFYFE